MSEYWWYLSDVVRRQINPRMKNPGYIAHILAVIEIIYASIVASGFQRMRTAWAMRRHVPIFLTRR